MIEGLNGSLKEAEAENKNKGLYRVTDFFLQSNKEKKCSADLKRSSPSVQHRHFWGFKSIFSNGIRPNCSKIILQNHLFDDDGQVVVLRGNRAPSNITLRKTDMRGETDRAEDG